MMRVRVEGNPQALTNFLTAERYEHLHDWSPERIATYCTIARLEEWNGINAVTFGYVWAVWLEGAITTLDFHACIMKPYRLRWFALMPDLEKLAGFLGAQRLYTDTPGDPARRKLMGDFLIRRFGFTRIGDGAVYKDIG